MAGPGYSTARPAEAPSTALATASISGSTFDHNQAIAGNGTTGVGVVGNGQSFGGAIYGGGSVTFAKCTLNANLSVGGNGGTGQYVGDGQGGAIFWFFGSVTISGSTFDQNQAMGGSDGNSGAGNPAPFVAYALRRRHLRRERCFR